METNLWGDIFNKKDKLVNSPKKILEEQANEFNKRTQDIVCSVTYSFEEPTASWASMNSPFEESEQKEKDLVLKMRLSVPGLNNYSIVILTVKYLVSKIYPCQVKNLLKDDNWVDAATENDFVSLLKNILVSPEISKLLTNLVSQLHD